MTVLGSERCRVVELRRYALHPGQHETLRPVVGLEFDRSRRAALGNTLEPPGLLAVTIWPLARATAAEVPGLFTGVLKPALGTAGISVLATYATEHSENTFPGLPVRESENVFVWMSMFEDETDHARHIRSLDHSSAWRDASQTLVPHLGGPEEVLKLRPTANARAFMHERDSVSPRPGRQARGCRRRVQMPASAATAGDPA